MSVESTESALLSHLGPWTEADYHALGESEARIELIDGSLLVSPHAGWRHQFVTRALVSVLARNAHDGCQVVESIEIRLWKDHIRIPDVVAFVPGADEMAADAADVVLLAEVTSPSNFRQDRIVKHGEYAEAGIPFYLRVDLHLGVEELTATLFELVDGEYVTRVHAADGVLRLERPWPVGIDLRAAARG
jgi:Uma2 family endonuclease